MRRDNLLYSVGFSLILVLSFHTHAFSISQTNDAVAASKLAHIQVNAKAGDPDTQYLLGLMRLSGRYIAKDVAKGLYWLRLSADSGYAKAQRTLADFYFDGKLVDRNFILAESWYLTLAESDNRWAQFRLGFIYASGGFGVKRHCGKAVSHFRYVGDRISLGNVAWILATCPESEFRDGNEALALSKKLLEKDGEDPTNLDNLAAAYAELGLFSDAVVAQQRAILMLNRTDLNPSKPRHKKVNRDMLMKVKVIPKIDEFKARLKNYQEHKAYREIVPLLTE